MAREKQPEHQLGFTFEESRLARHVWPVAELVRQVRVLAETAFADVWVEGEISNMRPASSGHMYFTLKDADAQLPVVLFRRQAMLLRFRPEDGLHVVVRGRASVYEQRGQLQLVAETMEPVGAGSLQLAFEQLKAQLAAEGLFDAARKQPLPEFPRTVGIVTSPTGAVIRDFLNIVGRRHSGLNVLLYPAAVQGDQAPAEIEAGVQALNRVGGVDVIVVARGGGSLEDLAAFNSERVARALAASQIPVVSAVGHETDFTIADFVADLRAPTPSAAAELITDAQYRVAERVSDLVDRLERGARYQWLRARQRLDRVQADRAELRINMMLRRAEQRLDDASLRLEATAGSAIRAQLRKVESLERTVMRHDPRQRLAQARAILLSRSMQLKRAAEMATHDARARWHELNAQLLALSPLAVLERGYSLALAEDGRLIRSTAQVAAGQTITTRLSDGTLTSRVETATALKRKKK